jgi:putative transposase
MSRPRQFFKQTTYLVTRRVSERRYFLRPDAFVTQLFTYLLAVASERFGVAVVAACVLSNHWHGVVVDMHGLLPRFMAMLHRLSACAINSFRGRREAVWTDGSYNKVRLVTREDVLDKIVYVLANTVKARLVRRPEDWPGLVTLPELLLVPGRSVQRPGLFFAPEGDLPTEATLLLAKPPGFDELTDGEFVALVRTRLQARLKELWAEARREGKSYLGAKVVLRQAWQSAPDTPENRGEINPDLACRDSEERVAALEERAQFLTDYRTALRAWCDGDREVEFPAGTWWMRVFHNARCVPEPSLPPRAGPPPPAPPPPS